MIIVIFLEFEIQDLAMMESMHLGLENVVITIFDGSNEYGKIGPDLQHSIHQILEGLITTTSISLKLFFRSTFC